MCALFRGLEDLERALVSRRRKLQVVDWQIEIPSVFHDQVGWYVNTYSGTLSVPPTEVSLQVVRSPLPAYNTVKRGAVIFFVLVIKAPL